MRTRRNARPRLLRRICSAVGSAGIITGIVVALALLGTLCAVPSAATAAEPTFIRSVGSEGSGNGQFHTPSAVAVDWSDNLWVADTGDDRLEEFNSTGEYLRQFGSEGSGNGQFSGPSAIAVDWSDHLWVADEGNNRLEEFNSKGEYLRQVGTKGSGNGQFSGPAGIAIDGSGDLWVSDRGNNRLEEFNSTGEYLSQVGSEGSGNGQFSGPTGIAVDVEDDDLWVTDKANNRVEEFNSKGEYLSQFGSEGSGNGQFSGPTGIAVDSEEDLWVLDTQDNRLEEFSQPPLPLATTKAATGVTVSTATLNATVNPEGSATTYYFEYGTTTAYGSKAPIPAASAGSGSSGVEVSQAIGGLAQGTTYYYRVRAESAAGTSYGKAQTLKTVPLPLATTKGAADVTETTATLSATVNPEGSATTYYFEYGTMYPFGSKAPIPAAAAGSGSSGVEVSQAIEGLAPDTAYIYRVTAESAAGTSHGNEEVFTSAGSRFRFSRSFGSEGSGNGQFYGPGGVAPDSAGNLWVADNGGGRVQKFNGKGEYLSQLKSYTSESQLSRPGGIAVDDSGNVWVIDGGTSSVKEFTAKGEYLSQFGSEGSGNGRFSGPSAIATQGASVWVADSGNDRVERFNSKGEYLSQFGSKGSGNGQISGPSAIAVGFEENLWVADSGNDRVEEFNFKGEYLSQFGSKGTGNGQFSGPSAIAVDGDGNLWVADSGNDRVEKFNPNGEYLAQFGESGSGNGQFSGPSAIATDPEGNLWIVDGGNDRVEGFSRPRKPTATIKAATKVGGTTATLNATVNPQVAATTYYFEYGPTTSYGSKAPVAAADAGSAGADFEASQAVEGLEEDTTYHYRVVTSNEMGTTYSADETLTTHPETTITSPTPSYTDHEEIPVTFTSDASGATFKCRLDGSSFASCSSPYSLPAALGAGWHTFEVEATDTRGVTDPTPASWTFNPALYPPAPSTSKLVYPEDGKKTASYYTLKAEWGSAPVGGGVTGVSFQMELPKWEEFKAVPAECVIDGAGKQVSWPLAAASNPGHTEPVFLKVKGCAPFEEAHYPEEEIKFRAVFDGGPNAAGASEPAATEFVKFRNESRISTDATETVGPASLDLLTGAFTLSRTDVSIPVPGTESNLEFTRVYDSTISNSLPGYTDVMGGWWQPSTPVESEYAGQAWRSLEEHVIPATPAVYEKECWDEEGETTSCGAGCSPEYCEEWLAEEAQPEERWMELTDNEGGGISFEIAGGSYVAPDYAKELKLTREDSEHIVLSDPNGTHTTFLKNGYSDYRPTAVSFQATPTSARMVYEPVDRSEGMRLKRIIAPSQAGISCGDWTSIETKGCRTLALEFAPDGKWGEGIYPSSWEMLESIRYYNASGEAGTSQKVAEYNYGSELQLTEEWDPRLPSLKEKYTYRDPGLGFNNLLTSLTPAGQEPWEFEYYVGQNANGEWESPLKSARRANSLGSPLTTTIAYHVPISGEGAPYDLSPSRVAEWGQSDFPVDATAIFPPTRRPAEPPTHYDYSVATIHYMDPDGYEVNTAASAPPGVEGDSITTTETDAHGNVVRSLSAQNRLLALGAEDTVARSRELDSHSTYSADGTEMLESWGPLHPVRLESGETVEARLHTTTSYDEGAPALKAGETAPRLPTFEITGAAVAGRSGDLDRRLTRYRYNWTLRKPTETIVDPGGLNIHSVTVYDEASGLPVQVRQPSNSSGGGAGTTKFVYYTSEWKTGEGELTKCESNAYAGLPCRVEPAAQPGTAGQPQLLVKTFSTYNDLDQPTEIRESPGGGTENLRKTLLTYDEAGRQTTKQIEGGGQAIPKVETTYNSINGLPTGERFLCDPAAESCTGFDSQETTTTYDALGRPESYVDADGNESSFAYNEGRLDFVSDPKGSQTIRFDAVSGLPVELEDSAAGTFTAAYNADGAMVEEGLPDGLNAETTYNTAGEPVHLTYTKQSYCAASCTWLDFGLERSIGGQILTETGTLGTDRYGYDKAGRLTSAEETPQGGSCTTRAYAYDADSNRTSLTTREPGIGGACAESGGTTQNYSYDAADRLEGPTYDSWGRITSLPAEFAGGKTLTTSYFSNDMVATQSQGGITNTFTLDASLRQRSRLQAGGLEGTEVFHYDGPSDSPAWTERGQTWTRSITGIGGELAAVQESGKEITLQLTNLHGDVSATAPIDPEATSLNETLSYDEFGNPTSGSSGRYGWLGGKQRRTELPSGVIQMGKRSYVPSLGRFLTPDPVFGGSANPYDYAAQDPINAFDLGGETYDPGDGRSTRQLRRRARRVVARAKREAREHHVNAAVVRARSCTAVACKVGWPQGNSKVGAVEELASKVVHYLETHESFSRLELRRAAAEFVTGGPNSPSGQAVAGCAQEASEGWAETEYLRAGPTPAEQAVGYAAAVAYAATKCVLGTLP